MKFQNSMLHNNQPKNTEESEVISLDILQIGDIIEVRSGELIPADGKIIDGTLNGIALGFVPMVTRLAGRAQSGYIFTYAFAMVIGIVVLVIWMSFTGGGN